MIISAFIFLTNEREIGQLITQAPIKILERAGLILDINLTENVWKPWYKFNAFKQLCIMR